jgi:hypothetical protein
MHRGVGRSSSHRQATASGLEPSEYCVEVRIRGRLFRWDAELHQRRKAPERALPLRVDVLSASIQQGTCDRAGGKRVARGPDFGVGSHGKDFGEREHAHSRLPALQYPATGDPCA